MIWVVPIEEFVHCCRLLSLKLKSPDNRCFRLHIRNVSQVGIFLYFEFVLVNYTVFFKQLFATSDFGFIACQPP